MGPDSPSSTWHKPLGALSLHFEPAHFDDLPHPSVLLRVHAGLVHVGEEGHRLGVELAAVAEANPGAQFRIAGLTLQVTLQVAVDDAQLGRRSSLVGSLQRPVRSSCQKFSSRIWSNDLAMAASRVATCHLGMRSPVVWGSFPRRPDSQAMAEASSSTTSPNPPSITCSPRRYQRPSTCLK